MPVVFISFATWISCINLMNIKVNYKLDIVYILLEYTVLLVLHLGLQKVLYEIMYHMI